MTKKSVISLISYDSHLLPASISSYYDFVDEIILGLDEDRVSWSKNKFSFQEENLWKQLRTLDRKNKITIVEDNFHSSSVPLENDNYERNFLKGKCQYDWIFSFDADEVLINASEFFYNFTPYVKPYCKEIDLQFSWFLPYKELSDSYLLIANNDGTWFSGDKQGFATHKDNTYTYCRWSSNKKIIDTPLAVMHWSFCRKEEEVNQKINNFGHSDKTANDPFFNTWKMINEHNFMNLRNFKTSGFGSAQWEKLIRIKKEDIYSIGKHEAKRIY